MKRHLSFFLTVSIFLTACGSTRSTGWKQLSPTNHPPANGGGGAAYNTQSQSAVYLGGFLNETWLWNNGNWVKANPANQPPLRAKFGIAYDEARNKVVVFGGAYDKIIFNDTWEWDGINWKQVNSDHFPPARCCLAMAYDAVQHKILMYGGWDPQTNTFLNDLWLWDGSDWTEVTYKDVPLMSGHKMVSYSSEILSTFTSGLGTWIWDGYIWSHLDIESPPDRPDSALAYDTEHDYVILFGGKRNGMILGDTWAYDGEAWAELKFAISPSPRDAHAMFYDAKRGSIILFGGVNEAGALDDTWELTLSGDMTEFTTINTTQP